MENIFGRFGSIMVTECILYPNNGRSSKNCEIIECILMGSRKKHIIIPKTNISIVSY